MDAAPQAILNVQTAPLKIGFVGLAWGGYIAEQLISGPDRKFFTVAAVCDLDESKAAEFAGRHGIKAYSDLDKLLADKDIPVIGLFTGPSGRADLLRRIIRAGKDVMTTKPFERDPAAARSVLEEATRLGKVIQVNSPPPEPPGYLRQVEAWQQEFSLGRPISCRGEMLASYREKADGRWLDDPAQCPAAPLFRLGIYPINDLIRLFGRVSKVQVLTSRILTGRPTPDNARLGLLFENGALGDVHASFCVDNGQSYADSLILNYERGTVYRNVFPVEYGRAESSSRLMLAASNGHRELIIREAELPELCGEYRWETFHSNITGRQSTPMPIAEIVHGVEIIAAMARAEQSENSETV